MNYISGLGQMFGGAARLPRLILGLIAAGGCITVSLADTASRYDLDYTLTPVPEKQSVDVELRLGQPTGLLLEMRFDAGAVSDVKGDGEILEEDGKVRWLPPADGGSIRWRASAVNKRSSGGYDAWLDEDWGLFRAEDVIPRAATRAANGAESDTTMRFDLPDGWSVVTEFLREGDTFLVPDTRRRFQQPTGWIVMGQLGVRREVIAGSEVAVAGPTGQGVRRMDMLAMLNWTLPELARILPSMPPRITIFSAGKPMWRGGLSAPRSFFMHVDRPMISENGTSTLLHEVMHVAIGITARTGYDWIVEGFAEYYSLQLLSRSGTITSKRLAAALDQLSDWSRSAESLCGKSSTGAETALAVLVMRNLDTEIRNASLNSHNLDDVLYRMIRKGSRFDLAGLRDVSEDLIGAKADALHSRNLPGCSKLESESR